MASSRSIAFVTADLPRLAPSSRILEANDFKGLRNVENPEKASESAESPLRALA